ncbi:MAG: hypothetical protein HUJ72_09755 [Blautia sp.]|nr:hypothetical protein [Blautia sp.]
MKEKFNRFMQKFMTGRYGVDDLSKLTMTVALASVVLSLFVRSRILNTVSLLAILFTYYRMFSRNISKRYQENQKYLSKTAGIRNRFRKEQNIMKQRKTHHIYSCPGCGQKIRIPRGKGKKVEIDCPKCHTKFIKKI